MTVPVRDPVRIGNCSGFYGDRLAAMREMLTGGELDYLTGDYLAELTMLILARDRAKSPDRGYAKTFLTQLEDCLGTALDQGVRIVANAGGLNPAGLAAAVRALAERLGLHVNVAHVEGDDLVARAERTRVRHPAGGQRLPRRVGHRRLPQHRRRRRRHRPGHRRLGDRRARPPPTSAGAAPITTRWPARWPPATSSSAAPRPPAATSRSSPRSRDLDASRLPARRDRRRRIVGDHQARRAPAALVSVDTVTAQLLYEIGGARYAESRRDAARRHHRAGRRRAGPGADQRRQGRAAAADAEGLAEQHRRLPQRR